MMAHILKSTLKRSRSLLHRDLTETAHQVEQHLDGKLGAVEAALRATQLEINHHQSVVSEEIHQRVKNSGTLVLSESELLTKIFSGLKFYLDPRDIAVVPHLALDGIWEHRITAAWLAVVRPHDTVIDIGANFGYFGALAAQVTDKKKSKVVFFEANPHLMPYMRKTLAVNWLNEQSVLENLAIADKPGYVTLNLLKDYIGSSSVLPIEHTEKYMHNKMYLEKQEAIKVKSVSLDGYCKEHDIKTVDLIKMDIEGFEDKAYEGMRGIVQASPNVTLFIEFTKDSYAAPEAFYNQMLQDFGHVYLINDDGRIVRPHDNTYQTVIGDSDDWTMPIFSKNANLVNQA